MILHGFASQGYLRTSDNNFLALSKRGSFAFAEAAINATVPITDQLRAGVQLFTRHLGPFEDYTVVFDWFFVEYRVADWLGLKAGRVKKPFGLYNETTDVDAGRVAVLLPQSLYPAGSRNYLLAVTGIHLDGYLSFEVGGGLEYQFYLGTNVLDTTPQPGRPYSIDVIAAHYNAGGRILWETPIEGLRLGPSAQALKLDGDLRFDLGTLDPLIAAGAIAPDFDGLVAYELRGIMGVLSLEYAHHDLLLAAEYSRWWLELDSTQATVFPPSKATSERYHATATYRFVPWLTGGFYYAGLFADVTDRRGREQYQHDLAATLRFDIFSNWLIKLEGHWLSGTAYLASNLNKRPRSELTSRWAVALAKTTVYF